MDNSEHIINKNSEKERTDTPSNDHPNNPNTTVTPTGIRSQPKPPIEKHTEPNDSHDKRRDNIILGLQIVGLVVLTTYTIFTGNMMCSTQKAADAAKTSADVAAATANSSGISINRTLAIMEDQVAAMEKTARANDLVARLAEKNIITAQNQFRLDQRAWIGIEGVEGKIVPDTTTYAIVRIKNTGKSPAKHLKHIMVPEFTAKNDIPHFNKEIIKSRYDGICIAPQAEFFFRSPEIYFTTPILKAVSRGDIIFYVHGTIHYDDTSNNHHWTTYCWYYVPETGDFKTYIKEHNDTDD